MKDRIRQLRKQFLKLNQTEFGKKIGLGQQSIANIENGTNALTERNFEMICRTWNVNPDWLRNGVGEVFIEQKESVLQSLIREFELTPEETALIAALLELPQEYRMGVVKYVKEAAAMFEAKLEFEEKTANNIERELTREEIHAIIDAELDEVDAARKRATSKSSASTTLSGSSKRISKFP